MLQEQRISVLGKRHSHFAWSFDPGWRSKLAEEQVIRIAGGSDSKCELQEFLFQTRDPYLRQGVRFRFNGTCAFLEGFTWAYEALDTNASTGLASVLKAMVVADRIPQEIAEELGTTAANVVVFERLFWDIRAKLGCEAWLRALVAPEFQAPPSSLEEQRERLFLRTAFSDGWAGLRGLIRGEAPDLEEGLDSVAKKIEALAGQRALRYLRELDASGLSANEDDLKRFALLRSLRSREALASAGDAEQRCQDFGQLLRNLVMHKEGDPLPSEKLMKNAGRFLRGGDSDVESGDQEPERRRRSSAA